MCATCGCGPGTISLEGGTTAKSEDSHDHHHHHDHGHVGHQHDTDTVGARTVQLELDILAKNQRFADENRLLLQHRSTIAINLMSSPGAGKTTLLVETLRRLVDIPCVVIEGDQQTSNDAERIRATGTPAVQINTGKGCHLDAHMVGHAMERLPLKPQGFLFIENVGNLVCPAAFDLGESKRVVLLSTTEGEDKPLKYPDMFAVADLVLITKSDLATHVDFNRAAVGEALARVNPQAKIIDVSMKGEGLLGWLNWLTQQRRHLIARERHRLQGELARLDAVAGEGRMP